jgi:hypothetical protein
VASEVAQLVAEQANAAKPAFHAFDVSKYSLELFMLQAAVVGKVTTTVKLSAVDEAFSEHPFETSSDTVAVIAAAATFMLAFDAIGLSWVNVKHEPNKQYHFKKACSTLGLRTQKNPTV